MSCSIMPYLVLLALQGNYIQPLIYLHIQYSARVHICQSAAPWHPHVYTLFCIYDMSANQDYVLVVLLSVLPFSPLPFPFALLPSMGLL